MNRPSPVMLATAAGFLGGVLSQFMFQALPLGAQVQIPAHELRATRFALVDRAGKIWGEFKVNDGKPEIALYDEDGRVAWKATNSRELRPLASNPSH